MPDLIRSPEQLQADALAIWAAGVRAVQGDRLVQQALQIEGQGLSIPEHDVWIDLSPVRRIFVAGAGKAAAAMARGLAAVLDTGQRAYDLAGHVQIPESGPPRTVGDRADSSSPAWHLDLSSQLSDAQSPPPVVPKWLEIHAVRPAASNFPTPRVVEQTQVLLAKMGNLRADDLCLFVLSGGASALLAWPVDGVSLADKNTLTAFLAGRAASIEELNAVRSAISQVKAGGLARSCSAGQLVTLVISDVLGDPISSIGSGPTWSESPSRAELAQVALEILQRYDASRAHIPASIYRYLEIATQQPTPWQVGGPPHQQTIILGNTALAVDAAGIEAERRGYSHAMHVQPHGPAGATTADVEGARTAELLSQMNRNSGPDCLITGGETVVDLSTASPQARGGRNQHLGLAALHYWHTHQDPLLLTGQTCLVSGGTDGEDGNVPVAGVCLTASVAEQTEQQGLDIARHLAERGSFDFFRHAGGLLWTGPTHTNVCDLRVGVVSRVAHPRRDS
jgi:hydroxypyruvate reductase